MYAFKIDPVLLPRIFQDAYFTRQTTHGNLYFNLWNPGLGYWLFYVNVEGVAGYGQIKAKSTKRHFLHLYGYSHFLISRDKIAKTLRKLPLFDDKQVGEHRENPDYTNPYQILVSRNGLRIYSPDQVLLFSPCEPENLPHVPDVEDLVEDYSRVFSKNDPLLKGYKEDLASHYRPSKGIN